jgi:hypothetical protein
VARSSSPHAATDITQTMNVIQSDHRADLARRQPDRRIDRKPGAAGADLRRSVADFKLPA